MKHLGLWIAVVMGVLLTVFSLENMAVIEVSFLGQEFQTRRILLIGASVLIGFLLGKFIKLRR